MRVFPRQPGAAITLVCLITLLGLVGCKEPASTETGAPSPRSTRAGELFRVGSLAVYESDLERRIQEQYGGRRDENTRQAALDDLVERAQHVQAAMELGFADDPIVREELSRLLASRLREATLAPRLEKELVISEQRLRELYDEQRTRFQSPEKRQVAVLWLDSGPDPERTARYIERMDKARDFALQTKDILDHPEKGFSILSVDYSEHAASRFRGGLVGWMAPQGGLDKWSKAVAEIAYTLEGKGALSEVISRPEGVFLVRLTDLAPAVTRSFESVAAELERSERKRLRTEIEQEFKRDIAAKYPVRWPDQSLQPASNPHRSGD